MRLAAAQARWDLVEYLVSEGAAVDGVDAEGRSLCHYEVPPALHGGGALAAAVQRGIVSRFNKLIQRPMARLRGPHRPLSAFHRERLQNAEQRSAAPAAHTGDAAARRSIAVRESDGEGADDSSSGSDSGAVSGDETSSASSIDSARPSAVSGVPSAAASAASPSSVGRDATVLSAEESLDEDALLQDAEQTVRLVKQRSERAAQRRRGAGLALQSEQSEARGASDDNDDGGSEGDSPHQHADVSGGRVVSGEDEEEEDADIDAERSTADADAAAVESEDERRTSARPASLSRPRRAGASDLDLDSGIDDDAQLLSKQRRREEQGREAEKRATDTRSLCVHVSPSAPTVRSPAADASSWSPRPGDSDAEPPAASSSLLPVSVPGSTAELTAVAVLLRPPGSRRGRSAGAGERDPLSAASPVPPSPGRLLIVRQSLSPSPAVSSPSKSTAPLALRCVSPKRRPPRPQQRGGIAGALTPLKQSAAGAAVRAVDAR